MTLKSIFKLFLFYTMSFFKEESNTEKTEYNIYVL